jgi:probable HAF family extracellular repeat protein
MNRTTAHAGITWLTSLFVVGTLVGCASDDITRPGMQAPALAAASSPAVTSTAPSEAKQGMTLDVQVNGSGFDKGSRVDFLLSGQTTLKVHTNSVKYVSAKQLVANITIAADALTDLYDVAVTTSTGRKGIGTELFTISTMTDLGTLGGSTAYASAINSTGQIVGGADDAAGRTQPFAWSSSTGMRKLDVLSGQAIGTARAISDNGLIVGSSGLGSGGSWATLWKPNGDGTWTPQNLGSFGGTWNEARGVNSSGVIAGITSNASGADLPFRWTAGTGMTLLPLPPGAAYGLALGINDAGVIVGQANYDFADGSVNNLPVAWTANGPVLLAPLPGDMGGVAWAINSAGIITGKSGTTEVRWRPDPNSPDTWLAAEAGTARYGQAINGAGQIVGYAAGGPGNKTHAWLWQPDGSVQDLGALTKTGTSQPSGINSPPVGQAQVVGTSNGRAVRWQLP